MNPFIEVQILIYNEELERYFTYVCTFNLNNVVSFTEIENFGNGDYVIEVVLTTSDVLHIKDLDYKSFKRQLFKHWNMPSLN